MLGHETAHRLHPPSARFRRSIARNAWTAWPECTCVYTHIYIYVRIYRAIGSRSRARRTHTRLHGRVIVPAYNRVRPLSRIPPGGRGTWCRGVHGRRVFTGYIEISVVCESRGEGAVRAHAFNICKLAVAVAVAVYSRARACARVCTCVYVAGYTYVHIGRPPWGGLRSLNAV